MPLSTDVTLPRDCLPDFPDECVVCRRPEPQHTWRVTAHSTSLSNLFLGWVYLFVSKPKVDVPACRACVRRIRNRRALRLALSLLLVGLAWWLAYPLIEVAVPRPLRRLALLAIAAVGGVIAGVWLMFRPLPFDVTLVGDNIDYEFADPDQAHEFALRNDAWPNAPVPRARE